MQKACWALLAIAACCAAPASADVVIGTGGVSFSPIDGGAAGVFSDGAVDGTLTTNAVNDVLTGTGTIEAFSAPEQLGVGDEEWNVLGNSLSTTGDSWTFSWDVDAVLKGFSFLGVNETLNGESFTLTSAAFGGSANSGTNYEYDPSNDRYIFTADGDDSTVLSAAVTEGIVVTANTLLTLQFNSNPTASGNFADFRGFTWDLLATGGSGGGAGVPEPSSFALMGLIGAGVMYRRRRQAAA